MRENMPHVKYATPEEWFRLFWDESINMTQFRVVGTGECARMEVRYTMKEEFYQPLTNVNVAIAALVTSHARLRLYSLLEKLQDRCLYFDTGTYSILFPLQP